MSLKTRLNLNLIKSLDPTANDRKQRGQKNISQHDRDTIMKNQTVGTLSRRWKTVKD